MKYKNGKITKSRAIKLAVFALHLSIIRGDIQSKDFDDALEILENYYNINETL